MSDDKSKKKDAGIVDDALKYAKDLYAKMRGLLYDEDSGEKRRLKIKLNPKGLLSAEKKRQDEIERIRKILDDQDDDVKKEIGYGQEE